MRLTIVSMTILLIAIMAQPSDALTDFGYYGHAYVSIGPDSGHTFQGAFATVHANCMDLNGGTGLMDETLTVYDGQGSDLSKYYIVAGLEKGDDNGHGSTGGQRHAFSGYVDLTNSNYYQHDSANAWTVGSDYDLTIRDYNLDGTWNIDIVGPNIDIADDAILQNNYSNLLQAGLNSDNPDFTIGATAFSLGLYGSTGIAYSGWASGSNHAVENVPPPPMDGYWLTRYTSYHSQEHGGCS